MVATCEKAKLILWYKLGFSLQTTWEKNLGVGHLSERWSQGTRVRKLREGEREERKVSKGRVLHQGHCHEQCGLSFEIMKSKKFLWEKNVGTALLSSSGSRSFRRFLLDVSCDHSYLKAGIPLQGDSLTLMVSLCWPLVSVLSSCPREPLQSPDSTAAGFPQQGIQEATVEYVAHFLM